MMNLDTTFAALADPTRRAILARLAQSEATVGELCAPFEISGPAISRHLKVLEQAALITRERAGQHRRCRLTPAAMGPAAEWIETTRRFWSGSLDRLADHLERQPQPRAAKDETP
jgi:DNA-binding transcriptional ArsR family regulator